MWQEVESRISSLFPPSIPPIPLTCSFVPSVPTSNWCLLGPDAACLGALLFLMSHGIIKLRHSGKPKKLGSMCAFGALQECSCLDVWVTCSHGKCDTSSFQRHYWLALFILLSSTHPSLLIPQKNAGMPGKPTPGTFSLPSSIDSCLKSSNQSQCQHGPGPAGGGMEPCYMV